MKDQLSLLEKPTPPGTAPVWNALDAEQRALVVFLLVRLTAKAIAGLVAAVADEENNHE